jgi:osmotically-inducible protein OsmY
MGAGDAGRGAVFDLHPRDNGLHPSLKVGDVRAGIETAFRRSAEIDGRGVNVTVQDSTIVLSGSVRSWAERRKRRRHAVVP